MFSIYIVLVIKFIVFCFFLFFLEINLFKSKRRLNKVEIIIKSKRIKFEIKLKLLNCVVKKFV